MLIQGIHNGYQVPSSSVYHEFHKTTLNQVHSIYKMRVKCRFRRRGCILNNGTLTVIICKKGVIIL